MRRIRRIGLAGLLLLLATPSAMALPPGGVVRGGIRGAMVGGMIGAANNRCIFSAVNSHGHGL